MLKPRKGTQGREMNRKIGSHRHWSWRAAMLVSVPAAAFAGSPLLSGYGGPGAGEQAILGSTLIGGIREVEAAIGSGGSGGVGRQRAFRLGRSFSERLGGDVLDRLGSVRGSRWAPLAGSARACAGPPLQGRGPSRRSRRAGSARASSAAQRAPTSIRARCGSASPAPRPCRHLRRRSAPAGRARSPRSRSWRVSPQRLSRLQS